MRRGWTVVAVSAVALLPACDGDPGRVSWHIELAEGVDRGSVHAIEAWIARDGCERSGAEFTTRGRPGETGTDAPGSLPEGRWGFGGAAMDVECRVIAEGCAVVDLPFDTDRTITTVLDPLATPRHACPRMCVDGDCASPADGGIDGGPERDAAGEDAGARDAGLDAGARDAGLDAGARDAGLDAGTDACADVLEDCVNDADDDCDGLVDCEDDTFCADMPECAICGGRCGICETCVGGSCTPATEGSPCNAMTGLCRMGLCCEDC